MSQASHSAAAASVLLESREGSILTLTMNRPDKLNALDSQLDHDLVHALTRVANDRTVHVVILTGTGRAFCAGGDLGVIGKGRAEGDETELGANFALKESKSS